MKRFAALLLVLVLCPALAQPGQGRARGQGGAQPGYHPGYQGYQPRYQPGYQPRYQPGPYQPREYQRPMPPPERRMGWEERQQLREQVRGGEMSRDEARARWREERARRSPEERQQLRRDVLDANRDLERR
jgi:hypothetical protein